MGSLTIYSLSFFKRKRIDYLTSIINFMCEISGWFYLMSLIIKKSIKTLTCTSITVIILKVVTC
jgi:hypothetical protein